MASIDPLASTFRESGPIARTGAPSLYFYATMPGSRPKAIVALLHGYAEYAGRYAHVAEAWAARGIATVAIDMRGFGRALGRRGYCTRFEDYLDDTAALVRLADERGQGVPPFLFGHSFGGLVATSLVLANPAPWRGLMLSSPFFGLAMKAPPLKRMAGLIASRLFPTLSLPSGLHGADVTHDPVLARAYDDDPLVFETANARWFTETQAAQARILARAASLSLPLCVVAGTEDRVADLASTRAAFSAAGSTDKTLDVREGLRHEPLSEPEWRGVADFFADWVEAHLPA